MALRCRNHGLLKRGKRLRRRLVRPACHLARPPKSTGSGRLQVCLPAPTRFSSVGWVQIPAVCFGRPLRPEPLDLVDQAPRRFGRILAMNHQRSHKEHAVRPLRCVRSVAAPAENHAFG